MPTDRQYRALVIAPSLELKTGEEASVISNVMDAKTLSGTVRKKDIVAEIQRQFWEIIWFSTHGTAEGIVLSDEIIGLEELVPIVRNAQSKLLVLNTCSSIHVALRLRNETNANVICTVAEIADEIALNTARHLAHRLSIGDTYLEAYENSKPGGNADYVFLLGKTRANGNGKRIVPNDIDKELDRLKDDVERLNVLIDGDERWGAPGLIPQIAAIKTELHAQKTRQTFNYIIQWLTFTVVVILLIAVGFLIFKIV